MRLRADASRDMLFGLLALHNGMVNRDQLVAAFGAWTGGSGKPMGQLLLEQGALTPPRKALLDDLVADHLVTHGGDPERSLAALDINPVHRDGLAQLADPVIEASLVHVGTSAARRHANSNAHDDPDRTASLSAAGALADGQRFHILRPHARGGLGAVFVALDTELHREVALKQILDAHAEDAGSRQRFLLEAEVTGNLEHPGIVPVYSLGAFPGGRPYYAMRFIKGATLKEAIDRFHAAGASRHDAGRHSLELHKLLRRFIDVCNAVDYAHSRGVLHRDLKPGNIIVGRHGETLVVDWGLAKAVGKADPAAGERTLLPSSASSSSETLPGSALGTPAYMSPEQAEGLLDRLGPRSDVYSLGATLYCLLTGKPPFAGDVAEMLRAVQNGTFAPPREVDPSIDRSLEAICLKAMALAPEDRYASAKALADDVERWMADEPPSAVPEPFSRRARRWAKRRRTAVTAAVAALLVGVIGLGAVLGVQARASAGLAAKNRQLEQTNTELAEARANVQARFTLAMDAIKAFHTGVSEDVILKEPDLKELRTSLLKSASDYYSRLAPLLEKQTDRTSRRALLQANFEVAELADRIGETAEALEAHRHVLAAREAMAAEPGADIEMRIDVGLSLVAVAGLLRSAGRTWDAEGAFRKAEELLSELARSQTAGPSPARAALARCRSSLAPLLEETGRSDEALAKLRLAEEDQEGPASTPGATAEEQEDLAGTHYREGVLLTQLGRTDEALSEYRAALALSRRLAHAHPAVTRFRRYLAKMHNGLGWALRDIGRTEAALGEQRSALAVQKELVAHHPNVTKFRSDLAWSHAQIGALLADAGRTEEALAEYDAARLNAQRIVNDHPAIAMFRDYLQGILHDLGIALARAGRWADAIAPARHALAIEDELVRQSPDNTYFRGNLANALALEADILVATGNSVEAKALCDRAISIAEELVQSDPERAIYAVYLADALLGRGQAQRAERANIEAAKDWRRSAAVLAGLKSPWGQVYVMAACCHAELSGLGGLPGSGVSAAEGQVEAETAMELLRKAVAMGMRNRAWLRTIPGLDPIRGRGDFRLIMMDIEFPAQPFARAD